MPRPAKTWLVLDEHPDSINDGYFINNPNAGNWQDIPASYHCGSCAFSFADGHSEMHRWRYASTKRPARPDGAQPLPRDIPSNERADFTWLTDRMSVERE